MSRIRALDIFYAGKLRELREQCNLKQLAAADLVGILQQHYSELESGKMNFTKQIVTKIYQNFLLPRNKEKISPYREWFKTSIFEKLSNPQNEENILDFILLYYKRESLIVQLQEVEHVLKTQWSSLTGENNFKDSKALIKIGYLNKKGD